MTNTPDRIALVMGLGRSGTTFLAKLIDTSPEVLYRHEPDVLMSTDLPTFCSPEDINTHLPEAKDYVAAMAHCRHWRSAGSRPLFAKAYRSAPVDLAYRLMVMSSKTGRRLHLPVSDNVPDLIGADRRDVLYLIKSVSSLGRARLFGDAVPSMTSVHIVRHPCAVYASLRSGIDQGVMRSKRLKLRMKRLFAHPETQNYPFSRREIVNATFEEQVAYRWMLANDKAAADMAGMSGYLRVGYEDLCADVDRVSRQIFSHLGLKMGTQTQRFIDDISRPATSAPNHIGYFKVKRPITSAVDKWKRQLDPESVEKIRKIVSYSPLGRAYFDKT